MSPNDQFSVEGLRKMLADLAPDPNAFNGKIIENPMMVDPVEDWSRVRSPGRARRRRHKHRQNIVIRLVPRKTAYMINGTMVMHPALAAEVRARMKDAPKPAQTDFYNPPSTWFPRHHLPPIYPDWTGMVMDVSRMDRNG